MMRKLHIIPVVYIAAALCVSSNLYSQEWKQHSKPAASGNIDDIVNCIYTDKKGNTWVGKYYEISVYDGKSWKDYSSEEFLFPNNVLTITADEKNNIWIGTANGISVFNGSTWKNYDSENGFCDDYISSINTDSLGNIWACSPHSIHKFDGQKWYSLRFENKELSLRSFIIDRKGAFWFCTDNGVIRAYNNSIRHYVGKDPMIYNLFLSALEVKSNILWFGSGFGILSYDNINWKHLTLDEYFPYHIVSSLVKDQNEDIWVGTQPIAPIDYAKNAGLFRVSDDKWYFFECPGKMEYWSITALAVGLSGNVWVGTYNNGLFEFIPEKSN